jgi:hypothetical protein
MNYGLPYKGSKNKLATRIVDLLPRKKHFYDLFCGGCAVTHAAMLSHKWDDFTINDINWQCPTLFVDALNGKYKDDTRWISREDFFRLKDTDPYVAFVWSFGNNLRDYIYSREIEPLKKAIHYALYFGDYSFAKELGHDLSFLDAIKEQDKRYSAVRHYFQQFGRIQLQSHEGGVRTASLSANWGGYRAQSVEANQRMRELANYSQWNGRTDYRDSIKKKKEPEHFYLEHHTRSRRLLQTATSGANTPLAATMWGGGKIHCLTGDYASVHIEPDSVIYCDIPYQDTNIYQKNGFDYERFYDWCFRQTEPVFISSYKMPSDFEEVAVFKHTQSLCATKTSTVYEKLFVPKTQKERLYYQQLSLF